MSEVDQTRYAPGNVSADGGHEFSWQLTAAHITDPVILELPPDHVLPVIFVPGIMGSNLRSKARGTPVWRLDSTGGIPTTLLRDMLTKSTGDRQKVLDPAGVEVDPDGAVPTQPAGSIYETKSYVSRGWGEVGETSYSSFLVWLEQVLNGQGFNPARWQQFSYVAMSATPVPGQSRDVQPLTSGIRMSMPQAEGWSTLAEKGTADLFSDDLIARARFRMPVYAFGYNWLDSNKAAADLLRKRIHFVIDENNRGKSRCSQVVLVTHSMGGLVARACQKLEGMQETIAGIVHGVMPAVGAAVAYRRCKIGMADEIQPSWLHPKDKLAAQLGARTIGYTGPDVTAVFAQAPGALQLLPTDQYRAGWLTIDGPSGKTVGNAEPGSGNPYQDIYLRQDRWWGLARKEWLSPEGGNNLTWSDFEKNVGKARDFHDGIRDSYHANTYVFYGKDRKVPSFEGVHWKIKRGMVAPDAKAPPTPEDVRNMGFGGVRDDGRNPLHVGGGLTVTPGLNGATVMDTSYWDLVCAAQDGGGDGTVPVSSGAFPLRSGAASIQQQFGLPGIKHEPAYQNHTAQLVALYALQKIASKTKVDT
ncbi:GPI inositol-deacylase [Paraburkholderia sp. CNPSo 3274]|uniref:esterase/lipase family protein n=1 Tax=Paraburkholderia sp. CNPSo 3274 TaxID=2940932 RepID=UPI0020B87A10|nr:GPI inositol-deacylase [Paraburkholderia sp. CNPSo 3274]MCP3708649.1 GPI inositol-deacylase [Paraburkholderia sp. CNPSo 3274]